MCIFSLSLLEGDWGEYKIIVHYYFSARSAFFPHPSIPHHTSTPAYTGTCTLTPCDAHGLRELARHSLHRRIHCSPASKPLGVQSRSGCLFRVHGLFMSHRKSVRLSHNHNHNSPSVSVTHPNPPGVFFQGCLVLPECTRVPPTHQRFLKAEQDEDCGAWRDHRDIARLLAG